MAIVTVPRPLQEQLGEAATESLVGMFAQLETSREQQQETHKEHLFELLEERFLRHVAESEGRLRAEIAEVENRLRAEIAEAENRLRAEMHAGFDRLQNRLTQQQEQLTRQQEQFAALGTLIGDVRAEMLEQIGDVHKQIGDVHKQIGDVHKQVARQTRWILTVIVGTAVLFPIIQRVMEVLLP